MEAALLAACYDKHLNSQAGKMGRTTQCCAARRGSSPPIPAACRGRAICWPHCTPRTRGDPYDPTALADRVRASVRDIVRRQIDLGIDVVDDGEHSKSSFAMYARARFGGLERTTNPTGACCRCNPRCAGIPRRLCEDMRVMFAARAAASGEAAGHGGAALHRTRQIYRTGRGTRRHRQSEGRARG